MSQYRDSAAVEAASLALLLPLLESWGPVELLGNNDLRQRSHGDAIILLGGQKVFFELKAEENHTGNLFFEEKVGNKAGWVHNLKHTHIILYHFLDNGRLYWMFWPATLAWFMRNRRDFKLRQCNDSDAWGRLVPVERIRNALPMPIWIVDGRGIRRHFGKGRDDVSLDGVAEELVSTNRGYAGIDRP